MLMARLALEALAEGPDLAPAYACGSRVVGRTTGRELSLRPTCHRLSGKGPGLQ